jgi:predicted aspartyl protease
VVEPTRRERLRPVEFIVMAAIIAVFVGVVVLGSTRELVLALVFAGVGFIVSLVVIAMLALAVKPDDAEQQDLDEQNHEHGGSAH